MNIYDNWVEARDVISQHFQDVLKEYLRVSEPTKGIYKD